MHPEDAESPDVVTLDDKTRDELLHVAAHLLRQGALIVVPTDTVYGLAARALDRAAVEAVYMAKCRAPDKKLPLLISQPDDLERYAPEARGYSRVLAERHWPGALTLVLPAAHELPGWLVDDRGAIALRCPDHAWVRELIGLLGEPVAATSANLSGMGEALEVDGMPDELLESVELVVEQGRLAGTPSTVVDCLGDEPLVLRRGSVDIFAP